MFFEGFRLGAFQQHVLRNASLLYNCRAFHDQGRRSQLWHCQGLRCAHVLQVFSSSSHPGQQYPTSGRYGRRISALRHLKTYISAAPCRSTMSQTTLLGLALLTVHGSDHHCTGRFWSNFSTDMKGESLFNQWLFRSASQINEKLPLDSDGTSTVTFVVSLWTLVSSNYIRKSPCFDKNIQKHWRRLIWRLLLKSCQNCHYSTFGCKMGASGPPWATSHKGAS